VSVFLDSHFIERPGIKRDISLEVLNLEPVFKVDG
jgi:hypothetical protein